MTSLLNPCSFLLTLLALFAAAARAQTPVGDLAKPPADAEHLIISSTGGKHGDSWIWQTPDGTRMGRESMNLRGQVFETDSATKFGAEDLPTSVTVRGFTPNGDAGETFTVADGKASWKSPIDAGGAPYSAPSFYIAFGGPMQLNAQFVERLIASPDKSLPLLPGGKATAEKLTSLEIGNGDKKKTVTAWAVSGLGNSPIPVWTNANNKFFGLTVGISWLPDGYESEREKLQKAQGDALAARMPTLAKSLAKVPTTPVAFTNVKLFDADNLHFLSEQTVVVDKGLIAALGPAAEVKPLAGAQIIDGKGPYTAQVANVATSQAEAISLVDKAKEKGFTGVKFYGTFNPEWLKPSIEEAHKLGLHVHGHIPAGIRPMDAINAGYDEITHINWVIMQAMPDDVIKIDNGIMRFEGPGRYARNVDLDAEPMKTIVATMAAKKIYSDPTMVAFEGLYVPENGDLSPAYAPFVGTLPPATERGFRQGGFAVPKDLTRADYRASWAKMVQLLTRMYKAGVPIVSGTDGSGIEIIRELEVYHEAGLTNAEALAAATITPARLLNVDKKTGSIKVGKTADLVLVEGDPSERISDLRQTRVVMLDGKLMDADALRTAAGFSGRPK